MGIERKNMRGNASGQMGKTLRMVQTALLMAFVIVFQLIGTVIHIGPTSISLVLIPITLGAMLLGARGGAFLGFVFGAIVYFSGVTGSDPFTAILFQEHPLLTALVCFGKGIAAGLVAGLLYELLSKWDRVVATFATAAIVPVLNTGLFILGALLMSDTLSANFVASGETVIYFLIIGCAGWNFVAELALNLIAAPALITVYKVASGQLKK